MVAVARQQPLAEQALGLLCRLPFMNAVCGDKEVEDLVPDAQHVELVSERTSYMDRSR